MPKWQGTYEIQAGNSFGDAYGTFVNSIQIPAPTQAQQDEIDRAREKWQIQLEKVRTYEQGIGKRWKDYNDAQQGIPEENRLTYLEYYNRFEKPIITSMRSALSGYQQRFVQKVNQYTVGYGIVADMIGRFSSGTATLQVPAEGTGEETLQSVYLYTVSDSLADFKRVAALEPSDAISWQFDKSSFTYHASETHWGGGASYGFFVRVNASSSHSHIDWHSSDFSLKFTAKAMQRFVVVPGDWYTGQLIKQFKSGPFVPGSPADIHYQSNTLWGPQGFLALRASSFVVVYEPSIEIKMAQADYQRNESSWSGGGGLSIGCFSFGASAGGSSTDIQFDSASSTIKATDTTGVPKIIAVVNEVFPDLT